MEKYCINLLSAQRGIEIWRVIQKMRLKEYLFLKKINVYQCIACGNLIWRHHCDLQDTFNFFQISIVTE